VTGARPAQPAAVAAAYRALLALFPRAFRLNHRDEVYRVLCQRLAEVSASRGRRALLWLALTESADLARTAVRLHVRAIRSRFASGPPPARRRFASRRAAHLGSRLMHDFRYALRQLRCHPGFAAIAVVTLGLGIGAATTIFSVVDHLMLRDLPFAHADRVVTLWQDAVIDNDPMAEVAPGNYLDWKERNQTLEVMGAAEPYGFDLTGSGRPVILRAALVTDGFFEALGARALLGRLFDEADYAQGGGTVAVLGFGLWQQQFGGDPDIIGQAIQLDEHPVTVIGVLQRDLDLGFRAGPLPRELWVPRHWDEWEEGARAGGWWRVIGRLAPGVTVEQAQADMDRVGAALAAEYPTTNAGVGVTVMPIREYLVGASRTTLLLLVGAVGMVLLVACANVANLLLARGAAREREYVVRAALGAGRRQLIMQTLIESGVIAVAGAALGACLAIGAVGLVKSMAPVDIPRFSTVAVNLRVLGFSTGLAATTALIFGLLPAWQLSRVDAREALAEGRATAGRRGLRLREGLIVLETAMALALMAGAALLLRSFGMLIREDPGFERERLAALQVFHYEEGLTPAGRIAFFQSALKEIAAVPGVQTVGAVSAAPFAAADLNTRRAFTLPDLPAPSPGEEPQTYVAIATANYFAAMGIPVLQGRDFALTDDWTAPAVVVINETLRRRFLADRDPIGRRIVVGESAAPATIIGVVGDTRQTGLDTPPRPQVFFAHTQNGTGGMTFFVRTATAPGPLLPAIQEAIWSVAPLQTFYQVETVEDLIGASLVGRRFTISLLSIFAGIGLALAAIGVYGVISFSVNRRVHEIGVRMALGADRGAVVRLVLARGLRMALLGVGAGTMVFLLAAPAIADLLYAVSPRDLTALLLGSLVLMAAAAVASWLPARRATRVQPMVALRHE